jgi:1-acyl-sn-glycerol-3-phosphate acyltransferase
MKKGRQRLVPVTLANLISSLYAFGAFLTGCIFLNVAGFFIFGFGKTTDKKKLTYHKLLYWAASFVVVRLPRIKTTYNHFDKKIFDNPAVIICNHQSHIDLMCIMSLTPKLVILTNDWVWNSVFYGRMIKYADYYPVSNGIENALDKLQAITEKGYSIVVFPEGTRSEDCSIQRFHKGAFYLAEQLKLDILPVLIHGTGHFLPKNELLLRKGELFIRVMPRIVYHAMGETLIQRAKNMRQFYISMQAETAQWIQKRITEN